MKPALSIVDGGSPPPPPDSEYVKATCKPGTDECCRYLTMGSNGWSCEKLTRMGRYIDERVAKNDFNAKGDNCEGRGSV